MEVFTHLLPSPASEWPRGLPHVSQKVAAKKLPCLKAEVSGVTEVSRSCPSNGGSEKDWPKKWEMGHTR